MLNNYVMINLVYINFWIIIHFIWAWVYIVDLGINIGFCEMIFLKQGTFQKSGREVLRERIFENKKLFSYCTMPLTEISYLMFCYF